MFDFLGKEKKELLREVPPIWDLVSGVSREDSPVELIKLFRKRLEELGFSAKEIELMITELETGISQTRIKVLPKPRIKVSNQLRIRDVTSRSLPITNPGKEDIDSFVREARQSICEAMLQGLIPRRQGFLASPANTWLMDNELQFLCARLKIQRVAFLYDQSRQHYLFITKVNRNTRLYDPMDSAIQIKSTVEIIQGEKTNRGDRAILSPDLEQEYFGMRKTKTPPYFRINFLDNISYKSTEEFIERIGRIQRNVCDCGVLVVYAALQSKLS